MTQTARINADFLRVGKEINSGLAFDFALLASLSEAAREPNQSSSDLCDSAGSYIRAGSAMFFAETEGELTLCSPAAFAAALYVAGTAPNRAKLLPSAAKNRRPTPPSEREAVRKNRRLSSIGPKLNRYLCFSVSKINRRL